MYFTLSKTIAALLGLMAFIGVSTGDTETCVASSSTRPDPTDCTGYFAQYGSTYVQQYCPAGSKYDESTGSCIVGKCPPCNCNLNPTTTVASDISTASDSTTEQPSTVIDTTTAEPSTESSTTEEPTTVNVTTTAEPGTESSTTEEPTTVNVTTTAEPSTESSTTEEPTTVNITTTAEPGTESSTTEEPTTVNVTTTAEPSTESSTTEEPSTVNITTTAEPGTESSTTEEPTTTAPPPTLPTPGTTCGSSPPDCSNVPNGHLSPDPVHCRFFWQCVSGGAVCRFCQKGMWYDRERFVCNISSFVHNCPVNQD